MADAQQRRRSREREDPQQRRMRLMYEAHQLEIEADALRDIQLAEENATC